MSQDHSQRRPNRLAQETSPYLLQHAYNPVDWHPWGPEALAQARELNKPILLSIGYSACHWCHVMERESFEDERIAALMNEHFICIKVDREERPDLDEIYMQATLAMNQGQGGWPMTVFLTPEQEPIFAGTYFPPTDRWGRPGFATVLQKLAEFWRQDPEGLRRQAAELTARLREEMRAASPAAVGETELEAAVTQFTQDFDPRYGGFGGAPKFPPATGLALLLRRYHRTGEPHLLEMVRKTLDGMAAGGMYDQIGGGFARYSTDERWLVPHFEKMLYDNAMLTRIYLEAFQVTQDLKYRRVATETLDYILREMASPEGGCYSATDADSEGVEGKFFVWTPEEIREAAGDEEEARRFCAYYDITPGGNWEHKNIPNTPRSMEAVARDLGITPEELRRSIERTRPLVYEARRRRVPPGLDDKVLTAWNGMMIAAMAEGTRILGDPRYLAAAERAATFLLTTLSRPDGGLYRTYRAGPSTELRTDPSTRLRAGPSTELRTGKAHLRACLEDYAYLVEALIDLYEAGGDERYLAEAVRLAERIITDFSDEEHGGFFTTAKDHESLIVRSRELADGATPSANAVAASALARLSFHYARDDFRETATKAVRAAGRQTARYPRAFAKSLIAMDLLLNGPLELALVGQPGEPRYEALRAETNRPFLPYRILAHYDPGQGESRHPLLIGKGLVPFQLDKPTWLDSPSPSPLPLPGGEDEGEGAKTLPQILGTALVQGQPALYICRNFSCEAPIPDPAAVAHALTSGAGSAVETDTRPKALGGSRLTGHATPGGTGAYAVRSVNRPLTSISAGYGFTACGSTGLTTGRLGFGGYRIDMEEPEHREALVKALRQGCNLIDTSTNYTGGESERLIGTVLAELIKKGEIRRDEIIVVSKIGYVQGQNLKRAEARERAGKAFPEMVKYGEGIWHCIHPEFLAEQLEWSLDRLGLETLDVCLLHNPEYFLSEAQHRKDQDLPGLRNQFYARLQAAFAYFETQVAAGRLRYYGVSSNTCSAEPPDPEAVSLSRMLDAAQAAAHSTGSVDPHFNVLQCPMNLFEAGAWLTPNTGPEVKQTVLELAQAAGLAVLVNRPLNAIPAKGKAMIRLADLPVEPPRTPFDPQRDKVAQLEEEYRGDVAPHVPKPAQGVPPEDYFRWAIELTKVRPNVQSLEHWEQIEGQMIAPHINQVLRALTQQLTGDVAERWRQWRERYLPELLALLREMRREATMKSRQQTDAIVKVIDPLLPESKRKETLSRKALWVLASTPGVTCVLNGMRTAAYVDDSLAVLNWEPLLDPRRVYEIVRQAE